MKAKEIFPVIEMIAPLGLKEDWDNPGYQMGNADREVNKIGVTHEWVMHGPGLVKKAIQEGCDLLLSHHPIFWPYAASVFPNLKPIQNLGGDEKTRTILEIARMVAESGVCIYASHTPWDKAEGGTRDSFARKLGINPILEGEPNKHRIGPVEPVTFSDFKKKVEQVLMTKIMYSHGPDDKIIKKIGAMGGSGLARYPLLMQLVNKGVDCIAGSEASDESKAYMRIHHPDIPFVEVHHSASERQGMHNMVDILKKLLPADITYTYIWEPEPIYSPPK